MPENRDSKWFIVGLPVVALNVFVGIWTINNPHFDKSGPSLLMAFLFFPFLYFLISIVLGYFYPEKMWKVVGQMTVFFFVSFAFIPNELGPIPALMYAPVSFLIALFGFYIGTRGGEKITL